MQRQSDLDIFYALLTQLELRIGGRRQLANADGRMAWPERGVYFFFENGEVRAGGGSPRVVRVGTHALIAGSRTSLWKRLSQHRGTLRPYGGNHRGSIFRLLAGQALMARSPSLTVSSWGQGSTGSRAIRLAERQHEVRVSDYLGEMSIIFLDLPDSAGPESARGMVERNSIAILSNFTKDTPDSPSPEWLGLNSGRERVRRSGLWNSVHVDATYDPNFLDLFAHLILNSARY
jgi:hypothetical protein